MNERNVDILEHIIRYCNEIRDARERFGDTIAKLNISTTPYRSILQNLCNIVHSRAISCVLVHSRAILRKAAGAEPLPCNYYTHVEHN